MWRKARLVIPRLSKDEWDVLDVISKWLISTRAAVFIMTEIAVPKLIWASRVFSKPRPTEAPADLPPNTWPLYLSAHAFQYNKRFGALFLLGLIIDVILVKTGVY